MKADGPCDGAVRNAHHEQGDRIMQSFAYHSPTKLHFGVGVGAVADHMADELTSSGCKTALVVTGGGSVRRNGAFDAVLKALEAASVRAVEISGIEPNPRVTSVDRATALCRAEGVDLVVAVGGGSTMDASKAICAAAGHDGPAWDLVLDNSLVTDALPLMTVNTIAATGSEYDNSAVISNIETNEKLPLASDLLWPVVSFIDPAYTITVPARQTVEGSCDTMSHFMEQYFVKDISPVAEGLIEGILRTVIRNTPVVLENPGDLDARSELLWASTLGCNGIAALGSQASGWPCHAIEHEVSARYDITHGIGLAILTPRLLRYFLEKDPEFLDRFAGFAERVMGLRADEFDSCEALAEAGLVKLEAFYKSIGVPSGLAELGIDDTHFEAMAEHIEKHWFSPLEGFPVPFTREDVVEVLKRSL